MVNHLLLFIVLWLAISRLTHIHRITSAFNASSLDARISLLIFDSSYNYIYMYIQAAESHASRGSVFERIEKSRKIDNNNTKT